jgi:hypothetical protein
MTAGKLVAGESVAWCEWQGVDGCASYNTHTTVNMRGDPMRFTTLERQILQRLQGAIPDRRLESMTTLAEQLHIAPLSLRTTVRVLRQQGYIGEQQMPGAMALYITGLGEDALTRDQDRLA